MNAARVRVLRPKITGFIHELMVSVNDASNREIKPPTKTGLVGEMIEWVSVRNA